MIFWFLHISLHTLIVVTITKVAWIYVLLCLAGTGSDTVLEFDTYRSEYMISLSAEKTQNIVLVGEIRPL